MEVAVNKLAVVAFFVVGVSHILRPRAWAQYFVDMSGRGEVGSLQNALLHFPLGVVIVAFHDVWAGLPVVLTLAGWGLVLKSFIYFIAPQHGLRVLSRVTVERASGFVVAGVFSVALSGLLLYVLLNR